MKNIFWNLCLENKFVTLVLASAFVLIYSINAISCQRLHSNIIVDSLVSVTPIQFEIKDQQQILIRDSTVKDTLKSLVYVVFDTIPNTTGGYEVVPISVSDILKKGGVRDTFCFKYNDLIIDNLKKRNYNLISSGVAVAIPFLLIIYP